MILSRPYGQPRGAVLPAMLLVSLSLLLLAAGTLRLIRADIASLGAMEGIEQSRMIARSGVRAFGVELAKNRSAMLQGLVPEVPARLELFEFEDQIAVAWLLPVGPSGETLVPEAGKLDLNSATAEMLEATGLFNPSEGAAIIAARESRPNGRFQSVHDLMELGEEVQIDEVRLYGDLEELRILSLADQDEETIGERIGDRLAQELGGEARGLLDVLTVHSFEPDVRSDGQPRVVLGGEVVEADLEFQSNEAIMFMEQIPLLMKDKTFSSEGKDLLPFLGRLQNNWGVMAESNESPIFQSGESWRSEVLDSVTIYSGGWRSGRVDINTASQEVLQSLPGLDAETAGAIIDIRESLTEEERFDRLWPVTRGVLDAEAWAEAFDFVTTRSMLWRARIVAGTLSAEDSEGQLDSPLAWEVLYDCSVDPPRLVEVRDISMLELAARMLAFEKSFETFEPRETDEATDAREDVDEAPLFDDEPLFNDDPLFDDEPLFNEKPMFDDEPLFGDDPLIAEPGSPVEEEVDPAAEGPETPTGGGPTGRWSPPGPER